MIKPFLGTWAPQPTVEFVIKDLLDSAFECCEEAARFRKELTDKCGIRLRDIVDHIVVTDAQVSTLALDRSGWELDPAVEGLFRNASGFFPAILKGERFQVFFRVEDIEVFARLLVASCVPQGKKYSLFRKIWAWGNEHVEFYAVERNGYTGYELLDPSDDLIYEARVWQQIFRTRRRIFDDPAIGLNRLLESVTQASRAVGQHWACALFLKAEREYWQSRNYAGRVQKSRQDALGIGWANQDHHTYDSSRANFQVTIRILETLGFECRERFYAGAQAGWGSQILEQPVVGSIVFADIDLSPEEVSIDFAHMALAELSEFRRAGLWTALHGESLLQAGLNHLECMYDSKILRRQLQQLGIEMMHPFSDFPHLYQELTVGEWWPVDPHNVDELEKQGLISPQQAKEFRLNGAIGSHFENLERNDGYKGFNQPGIDGVLRLLDPRKNTAARS